MRESIGFVIGISNTQIASITAPPSPSSSSSASRPAVCMMSSSSALPRTGTRIEPYSASGRSRRVSARSEIVTRPRTGLPCEVR